MDLCLDALRYKMIRETELFLREALKQSQQKPAAKSLPPPPDMARSHANWAIGAGLVEVARAARRRDSGGTAPSARCQSASFASPVR
jgi:hypothetical protein